jgi:hypothetical protein
VTLPIITRARHVAAVKRMAGYVQALTTENDELRRRVERLLPLVREVRFRDAMIRLALAVLGVGTEERR